MRYLLLRRIFLLCFITWQTAGHTQTVSFASSDLPIVLIKTNGLLIQNEPKITADMDIIYNGVGKRNSLTDVSRHFTGKVGIEVRGSSSQDLSPKKPLGFETRNLDGSNRNVSLLGMPEENDWILLAPYSDKSLFRDVLIHHWANRMLPYSSRTRFVEVLINNEYMGVYVLMEKIKRDDKRVNINKLDPKTASGDALTGGYIIKIDKTTGSTPQGGFNSNVPINNSIPPRYTYYQYDTPESNEINAQQKQYISNFVQSFESSIQAANWNTADGYRKYVDEKSLIDFFILNELSRNVDGYRLSTYMYKDVDSKSTKLKFGPVWDFNLGFGNANYCQGSVTEGLAADFNIICPGDFFQIPFYWTKIISDQTFYTNSSKRWSEIRKGFLSTKSVNALIDSLATTVNEAQGRNFTRWNILSTWIWPNVNIGGSYPAEVQFIKDWLSRRIKWLDSYFKFDATVAVKEDKQPDILVFPHPVSTTFGIKGLPSSNKQTKVELLNQLGQVVLTSTGWTIENINISHLPGGQYVLKIRSDDREVLVRSLLKQ